MNIYILLILAVLIAMYFVYNKDNICNSVKEGMTPTEESTDNKCGPAHNHKYCSSGKYCDDNGYCGITNKHKTDMLNYGYDAPDVRRTPTADATAADATAADATAADATAADATAADATADEQDKVGAVSTSMDSCVANCAAPVKASGRCEGERDGGDRRGYNDNPITDASGNYYKNCDNICLTPGMDGYVEKMPTDGTPYNPLVHGCRTSAQCKSCGIVKVDIPKDSGEWVEKERGGVFKRYWEPKNTASDPTGYANQNLTQCEMKRIQGLHEDTCPADSWTVDERERKMAASYQSYNDEDDEKEEVTAKHASDTDTGNMFLDVTNPDHIGKKDLSLEDYYNRQLLNKYSENRLGGSKSAYTDTYKPDKGQKKPRYFDSVWKLF